MCNHPRLCYPGAEHFWGADVVRTCGKMYWLDRLLVKLHASGHRVLLFSTMTKMLDTVEFYLRWRMVRLCVCAFVRGRTCEGAEDVHLCMLACDSSSFHVTLLWHIVMPPPR